MIEKPKKNVRARVIRAIIESIAQLTPLTAPIARLFQTTHPSMETRDKERWYSETTDTVNKNTEDIKHLKAGFAKKHPITESLGRELWEDEIIEHLNAGITDGKSAFAFAQIIFTSSGYTFDKSRGISSLTDNGVGLIGINFVKPVKNYIVSTELKEGVANVTSKTENGFSFRLSQKDALTDMAFTFFVVKI